MWKHQEHGSGQVFHTAFTLYIYYLLHVLDFIYLLYKNNTFHTLRIYWTTWFFHQQNECRWGTIHSAWLILLHTSGQSLRPVCGPGVISGEHWCNLNIDFYSSAQFQPGKKLVSSYHCKRRYLLNKAFPHCRFLKSSSMNEIPLTITVKPGAVDPLEGLERTEGGGQRVWTCVFYHNDVSWTGWGVTWHEGRTVLASESSSSSVCLPLSISLSSTMVSSLQ